MFPNQDVVTAEGKAIAQRYCDAILRKGFTFPNIREAEATVETDFGETYAENESVVFEDEKRLKDAQRKDPEYSMRIRYSEEGSLPKDAMIARQVILESDDYVIEEESGLLLKISNLREEYNGDRKLLVCVPRSLRAEVLRQCHDHPFGGAHIGRNKVYDRVRKQFYWKGMYSDIAKWVNTCPVCQKTKNPKEKSHSATGTFIVSKPMELISIDLMGRLTKTRRGNEYVLSVVDVFTKLAFAIAIPSKDPEVIARALQETIFQHYGTPERIHSDNGGENVGKIIEELKKIWDYRRSYTTAYHSQGNPFAEHIHHFYRNAIVSYINDAQDTWDEYLYLINPTYNAVKNEFTGFSPHELTLGREIRFPMDPIVRSPTPVLYSEYAKRLQDGLARAYRSVRAAFEAREAERIELDEKQTRFEIGQEVLLYIPATRPGLSRKLVRRWVGPFQINRSITDKIYELKDRDGKLVTRKVSVLRLKPYLDREKFGPKFYTQELDPRADFDLMRDPIVRNVVDSMKELNDLITSDTLDNGEYYLNEEVIDLYVPNIPEEGEKSNKIDEDSNDDEVVDESTLLNAMVLDKTTEGDKISNKDKAMRAAIGHEAYVDKDGNIRIKSNRPVTTKPREQRTGRGKNSKYDI
jgi:hypothetical protein